MTNSIILDYNDYVDCYTELRATKSLSSLRGWPRLLDDPWFLGGQIFMIGDTNFSAEYPLLGFARHLRAVSHHLTKNPRQAYVYFETGWAINRQLQFLGDGEHVIVRQGNLVGEPQIFASARASLYELEVKSSAYLSRVFDYCCSLVPQLKQQDDIEQWLNDLTHVTTLDS